MQMSLEGPIEGAKATQETGFGSFKQYVHIGGGTTDSLKLVIFTWAEINENFIIL